MTPTVTDRVRRLVHTIDQTVWSSAALVVALGSLGPDAHRRAAAAVLQALGIDVDGDVGDLDRSANAAQAMAPLLQAADLLGGKGQVWAQQSDEALLAQGRASAGGVTPFAELGLLLLPGLGEALARPGARMLDVGVGTAALAVAYAELFPALTVVGLDVMPRALALAAGTVAASPAADRVVLRHQDVGALDDEARYSLAWLPSPFVTEEALEAGVPRVARALSWAAGCCWPTASPAMIRSPMPSTASGR